MMGDWKEYTIGDLTKWFSGGTPSKRNSDFWDGNIPWISAATMNGIRYRTSSTKITKIGLENGSRLAEIDDIMLLVRGSGLYNDIPVGIVESPLAFNQDVKALRVNKTLIFPWFLLLWLIGNKRNLRYLIESTGIGAGKFDTEILKSQIIRIPNKAEQKEIIRLGKGVDDKIDILQQQNQTLEQIAQILFNRWFIDFEFPNEDRKPYKLSGGKMVESELGEIPEGWNIAGIRNLVNHNKQNESPFKNPDILFHHYSLPAYDDNQTPEISFGSEIMSNKYKITQNSFLVSKLNPSTPRVWPIYQTKENAVCSTEFQVIEPRNSKTFGFIYGVLTSTIFTKELSSRAHGTSSSHQRVKPDDILDIKVFIPDNNLMLKFSQLSNAILSKINHNQSQIQTLTQLRDTLLPKLMSGEIRIKS